MDHRNKWLRRRFFSQKGPVAMVPRFRAEPLDLEVMALFMHEDMETGLESRHIVCSVWFVCLFGFWNFVIGCVLFGRFVFCGFVVCRLGFYELDFRRVELECFLF